ncbi:sterol desaturase family protein [Actinokineospora xionganensis]|uniref:Sterol desaturase family protein n=1 Tax=Actinokineospora xionganensis TaxID=2684470 RepID=A0ABR7L6P7_9PSEU|nr:sterol desaturase family protein [Actinokineospora xionganensis]MBC6448314.1 sterol desaturase family protein [Actinokineospora xionganensis]
MSRRQVSLADCAREFARHPSPWLIGGTLVAAVIARVAVGHWWSSDTLLPFVMLALFPFFEWTVHVCVLHWRPRKIAALTIDPLLARKHREHHADPRDVPLVFIPWPVLLWLLPVVTAIALTAFSRIALGLTFLCFVAALGLAYEWTHYLIHSDYQPKSRLYRAVWRNHRLHHFKNEHYWFTVTTTGTADRVMRTYPDPRTVTNSPSVKDLHNTSRDPLSDPLVG